MIQTICYQNQDFSLIWKPHGIPSTFGKEKSFLDCMKGGVSEYGFTTTPLSKLLPADLVQYAVPYLEEYKEEKGLEKVVSHQVDTFGQDQEFGLLNRLDNDTAGFLYFARTPEVYANYKQLQKEGKIKKYYLAQVHGKLEIDNGRLEINFPIMHRTSEKMIAIQNSRDALKGRGKEHQAITQAGLVHYDQSNDISTLLVLITKGIRHQIRVHLASGGYPVIGDVLYGLPDNRKYLHLRSIGFQVS